MTDKQIIKAVEICRTPDTCRGCPYHELYISWCVGALMKDVFDLINRQKAEIERLKKKNTILSKNADTAFQDGLDENRDLFKKEVEPEIRNEAIKEFAERLKRTSIGLEIGVEKKFKMTVVSTVAIDNLVKEMTEASNR